jgi:hypothetical protein
MIKWENGEILIEKTTYKTVNICDDLCIYYQLKNGIIIAVLLVDKGNNMVSDMQTNGHNLEKRVGKIEDKLLELQVWLIEF